MAAVAMTVRVGASSVRRVDLYRWAVRGDPGSGAAGALLAAPERVLGAAGGIVSAAVLLAAMGLGSLLAGLQPAIGLSALLLIAVPVALTAVVALPRVLGRRWPEAMVRRAVPWLHRLAPAFAPFPSTATARGHEAEVGITLPEAEELTVLSGVLAFAERTVREVMTPRTEIVAVREGTSVQEIARLIADSGYSRVPMYRDSLDNIVGMVYAFDLLKISPGSDLPVRPVAMAPESKRCTDLLFEMQRQGQQFAVILDEFGGTAGIATFEDLLEELVGEILDEYDGHVPVESEGIDVLETSGATPADEIAGRFDVTLPSEAETVGGLLARAAGRIPRTGERLAVGPLEFDVLAATPNRVDRVVVRRAPVPVIQLPGEKKGG